MTTCVVNTNSNTQILKLDELHLYDSSHLGVIKAQNILTEPETSYFYHFISKKSFEWSNHLRIAITTFSDLKLVDNNSGSNVNEYSADLQSSTDYYPFGSPLPGRGFDGVRYRFGFNGKENDNEVYVDGGFQDYGMRMYDTRVGRFISVDPLTKDYPWYTPYQFAGNKPIWAIDRDGEEDEFHTSAFNLSEGKAVLLLARQTSVYKKYIEALKKQSNYDVYIYNLEASWGALTELYSSVDEIPQYIKDRVDMKIVERTFSLDKKMIFIGGDAAVNLYKQWRNGVEEGYSEETFQSGVVEKIQSMAFDMVDELFHAKNILIYQNFDATRDHKELYGDNGQKTMQSTPPLDFILNDMKYLNTNAKQSADEIIENTNYVLKTIEEDIK